MFEEEQGLNEENEENPELERNEEENNDYQESEEIHKDEEEVQDEETQELDDQQESEELDQDEETEEQDESQELEKNEEENYDKQESDEIYKDEEEVQEEILIDSEKMDQEVEKDQENIEQEILADLEEMDKEIDSLPSESEEIDQEEKEDGIPIDSEEMDNNTSREEISQGSIEEFIEQDQSESEEIPVSSNELSADEIESEEIDEKSRRKNIIEGALFVAGRPISLEELNIKTEIRKKDLEESLEELMLDYLMRATSLEIVQIQDKFSLQIKPEYTPNVKKFATGGLIPDRHLKTLTIIALKQPILKSKLVKIRGSGAYEHVKFLLDRGFINAMKKGRSYELMTTENFADTFGLSRDVSTLKKQMINQLGIDPSKNTSNDEEVE